MRKMNLLKGWIQVCPNVMNYVEQDEEGIHLHYATNQPWALYVGNRVVYRKDAEMACITKAWESQHAVLEQVRKDLDNYLKTSKQRTWSIVLHGKPVVFTYLEALILRDGIEGMPYSPNTI